MYAFALATAYTPEMVVDGRTEFVGSDSRHALTAIAQAALIAKADLQIEQRSDTGPGRQIVPFRVSLAARSTWMAKDRPTSFLRSPKTILPRTYREAKTLART